MNNVLSTSPPLYSPLLWQSAGGLGMLHVRQSEKDSPNVSHANPRNSKELDLDKQGSRTTRTLNTISHVFCADLEDSLYIFKGSHYWTLSKGGNSTGPLPLQTKWPELPSTLDAAAFSEEDGKFHFFKGRYPCSLVSREPGSSEFTSSFGCELTQVPHTRVCSAMCRTQ